MADGPQGLFEFIPPAHMPAGLEAAFWLVPPDLQHFPEVTMVSEFCASTEQLIHIVIQDDRPRPYARMEQCERATRIADLSMWGAYVLEQRKGCIDSGEVYLPPCTCCGNFTFLGCRKCERPWCEECIREGLPCHGCPPELSPEEWSRREAEALVVTVPLADLTREPADVIAAPGVPPSARAASSSSSGAGPDPRQRRRR